MSYYIPSGFGECVHRLGLIGDPDDMFVTIGWQVDGSTPSLSDVATGMHGAFGTFWSARGSDQYTLKSTKVTLVTVTGDPPEEAEFIGSIVGGSTSTVIPQNTAWLVHKNTGAGGRYNKGRMYIPGCFEALVNQAGVVDSTFQASYNTDLATLLTNYNGGTGVEAVVLLHNPRSGSLTPSPTNIASLTLDSVVSTQRRRLRR